MGFSDSGQCGALLVVPRWRLQALMFPGILGFGQGFPEVYRIKTTLSMSNYQTKHQLVTEGPK